MSTSEFFILFWAKTLEPAEADTKGLFKDSGLQLGLEEAWEEKAESQWGPAQPSLSSSLSRSVGTIPVPQSPRGGEAARSLHKLWLQPQASEESLYKSPSQGHPRNKYLLNTPCVPGTVVSAWDTWGNKEDSHGVGNGNQNFVPQIWLPEAYPYKAHQEPP